MERRRRKQLPQFNSIDEAIAFFEEYGDLEYIGRAGLRYEYCVYTLQIPGRRQLLRLKLYFDGKVDYLD